MKQPGRFLFAMAVVISLCWLVPIYLIGISALGPREAATAWPKSRTALRSPWVRSSLNASWISWPLSNRQSCGMGGIRRPLMQTN